ncbi:MAG TPA: ABC transporter substrate-binding protein [Candidatus Binatia bacterium]
MNASVKRLASFLIIFGFSLARGSSGEAQALRKIHAAIPSISPSSIVFAIARQRGYYREEGLDLDLVVMPAAIASQALIGGNVEFVGTGGAGVVPVLRGAPLQFLFVTFYRPQYWLYSKPELRSIDSLKGKRVGVSSIGSGPDSLLRELLKKHGLEGGRDVTIMAIGAGTARFVALKAGSVDATMLTPPANFMAQDAGFRELVSFIEQDLVEVQGSIFMRQELIKSDPVLSEKLVRATLKGLWYFRSNKSGSVAALTSFLAIKPDLAGRLYDLILPGTTTDGTMSEALQKRSIESVVERLSIKEPPPLDKIYNFAVAKRVGEDLMAKNWNP